MNEPPIEATAKEMFRLYYGLITPVAVDEFWRVHNDKESWLRLARWHEQKVLEAKIAATIETNGDLSAQDLINQYERQLATLKSTTP